MRSGMTHRAIADVLVVGGGLIVADIAPPGCGQQVKVKETQLWP